MFVKAGIPVQLPFGDNERCDLIAEFHGKLNRIQVKTCLKSIDGKSNFDLTSSTVHRKNGTKHKQSIDEVDYFFCQNIERDKSFLVKNTDVSITSITIRFEKPKNNNHKLIHQEKDFEFWNVINNSL